MNAAALPLALAVIAGLFIAIQAPTNAILGKASGSPVVAAFISFVVGTLALRGTPGSAASTEPSSWRWPLSPLPGSASRPC